MTIYELCGVTIYAAALIICAAYTLGYLHGRRDALPPEVSLYDLLRATPDSPAAHWRGTFGP